MVKILEYPGIKHNMYTIDDSGNIYNMKTDEKISERIHRGYRTVQLMSTQGKSKQYRLHRLVAYMFSPGYTDGFVVNHIDGNKLNCNSYNLEWVTQKENVRHAFRTHLVDHIKGESVNTSKLTETEVRIICSLLNYFDGDINNTYLISRLFIEKINRPMIQNIRNGATWQHVSSEYFEPNKFVKRRLSDKDIEFICEMIVNKNGDISAVADESKLFFKDGIPKSFIRTLISKRKYARISDKYFSRETYRIRLLDSDVEQICQELVNCGMNVEEVYNKLKHNNRINLQRIKDIKNKESHTDVSSKYF